MATIKGLKFDGGNDRLTFSNESLIGDFEVGIDFITGSSVTGAGNSAYTLLGSNSVDNIFFRYGENNKFAVNLGGAGADKQFDFTLSDNLLTNTRYFWVIKRVGQLVTVTDKELNSVVVGDWTTSTKDAVVNSIGSKGLTVSAYFNGTLLSLGINNARLFDVDASNTGVGSTVITDTVSSQNATGIGFPTDGSQFVDVENGSDINPIDLTSDHVGLSMSLSGDNIEIVNQLSANNLITGVSLTSANIESINQLSATSLSVRLSVTDASLESVLTLSAQGISTIPSLTQGNITNILQADGITIPVSVKNSTLGGIIELSAQSITITPAIKTANIYYDIAFGSNTSDIKLTDITTQYRLTDITPTYKADIL